MISQREQFDAVLHLPDSNRQIVRCSRQTPTILTVANRGYTLRMSHKDAHRLLGLLLQIE